jgi:hypothetical protein
MSALTVTSSPTVRLMGKRPPSISGHTRSTMTRRRERTSFGCADAAAASDPTPTFESRARVSI